MWYARENPTKKGNVFRIGNNMRRIEKKEAAGWEMPLNS